MAYLCTALKNIQGKYLSNVYSESFDESVYFVGIIYPTFYRSEYYQQEKGLCKTNLNGNL